MGKGRDRRRRREKRQEKVNANHRPMVDSRKDGNTTGHTTRKVPVEPKPID